MYTFDKNLKMLSFVLMIIGALAVGYGFWAAPGSVEEIQAEMTHDSHAAEGAEAHAGDAHHVANSHHDEAHAEHVLHQMQNRPWSAVYVSAFFFMAIAIGALFFLGVQYIGQAGWSVLLLRIMEAITAYVPVGGAIMLVLFVLSGMHFNHIFHWMDTSLVDPESANYDAIIAGKSGYLNVPFFIARAVIYIVGWSAAAHFMRKYSLLQDKANDFKPYNTNFKIAAIFTVFFAVTSSTSAWDWVMSFDPHWFSTLFGWYIFAGAFVTGVTAIALIAIYLKSKGYLQEVNPSHIHDLAKFMFGVSIFWTYLWFSQFMLIWYSNIPEEVTYYMARFDEYLLPTLVLVVLNFVFPLLVLMNSDFKKTNWFVVFAGIIIIIGHWLDIFVCVMPGSVGSHWGIGVAEIGAFLGFAGLFIFVVFRMLEKAPLTVQKHPMLKESENFHYYIIEHDE